jgi:dihydroflavonol-4-reductase
MLLVSGELPFRLLEEVWLATSDAADVGRCVAAAIERGPGGQRYFATGDCLRLSEVLALLSDLTGVAPPRRRLPDLLVEELGLLAPVLPPHSFLRQLVLPRDLVRHLRRLAPAVSTRTRETLGVSPTPFRETLRGIAEAAGALPRDRALVRG